MELESPRSDLVVVVNATEWRNLCARKSLRLLRARAIWADRDEGTSSIAAAFALAPTTKLDSSVDLLVLEVRPDWTETSAPHRENHDVRILHISDVLGHFVVDRQHLDYYRVEGAKAGVTIAGADYESSWRRWVESESTDAALRSAQTLASHVGIHLDTEASSFQGIAWASIAQSVLGIEASSKLGAMSAHLIRRARQVDDGAAAVRGTEAYLLACCVEWIDAFLGVDALVVEPIGRVVRGAITETRHREHRLGTSPSLAAESVFDLLEAAFPAAFSDECPAALIGPLASILTAAETGSPPLPVVYETLRTARLKHRPATEFACVVIGAAIGIERSHQLVSSTRAIRTAAAR